MATPKIALSVEEIRELLRPDHQCQTCNRITSAEGQWCPYCGGEVRHLGRVYEEAE